MIKNRLKAQRALARAVKLIRELGNFDGDPLDRKELWARVERACTKAEELSRYCEGDLQESCCTIRRLLAPAEEQAQQNAQARRNAEIAELRTAARDAQPLPGSWEHELALLRNK